MNWPSGAVLCILDTLVEISWATFVSIGPRARKCYLAFMKSTHDITKSARKPRSPVTGTPVLVRLQPEQLAAIDAWRRDQDNLPSRAEAIRCLATSQMQRGQK